VVHRQPLSRPGLGLAAAIAGVSANGAGEDSDPRRAEPEHHLGDTFRLSFTEPGVFEFRTIRR
jgi:hypothetical protein